MWALTILQLGDLKGIVKVQIKKYLWCHNIIDNENT